ncbi:MAG: hypothetical protein ACSHW4_09605 [Cellulophaga sp.]
MNRIRPNKAVRTLLLLLIVLTFISKTVAQGPNASEAAGFEPVDATDMVNLVTGDMSYVLPLLNVPSPEGGYPIALSYHAGIAAEQEASWVGLGWNVNPGAINRAVNGYPDDWGKTNINEFFYDPDGKVLNYYSIGIGLTLSGGVSVGLGLSWGDFKSVSYLYAGIGLGDGVGSIGVRAGSDGFSINGGLGGLNASIGTSGVGVSIGKYTGAGSSLGVNLNYNYSSGLSGGINISQSVKKGIASSFGVGIDFSSNGASVNGRVNGVGVGITNSTNGVDGTDYDVSVKSKGFTLPAFIFYASYNHKRVKYTLFKYDNLFTSGILYPVVSNETFPNTKSLSENHFMDVNVIPEFTNIMEGAAVIDEENRIHKNSLVLPNYDNYSVSAQGLSGTLRPYFANELNLSGRGRGSVNEDKTYVNYLNHNISDYNSAPTGSNLRNALHKVGFTMDDAYNSFLRTETSNLAKFPSVVNFTDENLIDYIKTTSTDKYSSVNSLSRGRKREGNFIKTYTNKEIRLGGIVGYIEAKGLNRQNNKVYLDDGIGAYEIVTKDGKRYHYSLPVYNFETFYKNFENLTQQNKNFFEISKKSPYATHWLLTAVTGPDYIDKNSNGKVDEGDYGYWVEFDYGKWTDGYAWRTPNEGNDVLLDGQGNRRYAHAWGRKQLYYLDAIKTRTHTALFVKSMRKDNLSSSKVNSYKKRWTSGNFDTDANALFYNAYKYTGAFNDGDLAYTPSGQQHTIDLPSYEGRLRQPEVVKLLGKKSLIKYVDIPINSTLKLDKILLLKNKDALHTKNRGALTQVSKGSILVNFVYNNLRVKNLLYTTSYSENVLSTTKSVLNSFDIHMDKNVLDIKDIEGLNLESKAQQVITFDHDYSLAKNSKNSLATGKGRLTLKKVNFKGKQGVQMIPPYSFSYLGEGSSFSENNIDDWGYNKNYPHKWSLSQIQTPTGGKLKINYESDSYYAEAASYEDKYFTNISFKEISNTPVYEITFNDNINISDYFKIGKDCLFSYRMCDRGAPIQNTPLRVTSISGNKLIFRPTADTHESLKTTSKKCVSNGNAVTVIWDLKIKNNQYPLYTDLSPNGKVAGGIRVKSIELLEEGKRLITEYKYTDPKTGKISGITSYAPFKEAKFIPYVSELPAPMVMYSDVRVTTKGDDGIPLSAIEYKFQTLKPISSVSQNGYLFNIGDALKVKRDQNSGYFGGDILANKYTIYNSIANLGRMLSIATYNSEGQRLAYSTNTYKTNLDTNGEIGVSQESHKSLKKVVTEFSPYNNNEIILIDKIYASSTSKVSYPSVLESSTTVNGGYTSTKKFVKYDFLTGQVLESTTSNSKGEEFKSVLVPAYIKYTSMGSKLDNASNSNMLTQSAMTKTFKKINNAWKEIGVGINTWKPDVYWKTVTQGSYPNELILNISHNVWRKHKSFVWNGTTDSDGIFTNFTGEDDNFNWSDPNASQPSDWKQVSEISKYNNYSMPLEVVDVNGNFAATKMGYNNAKVMATGNAGYNELYYSGAEDLNVSTGKFGEDVAIGTASLNSSYKHTGSYSLQISSGKYGYSVNVVKGKTNKYKVSLWAKKSSYSSVKLKVKGVLVSYDANEVVKAGDWVQLNFYFNVAASANVQVTTSGSTVYVDDFRLQPVASSMMSYVYNKWDEVTHIIGANNMATKYEYDVAGRLLRVYAEVVDFNGEGSGGFKKAKEHQYKYKLVGDLDDNGNNIIDEEETYSPLNSILSYSNGSNSPGRLTVNITGGSGNYKYSYAKGLVNTTLSGVQTAVDNLTYGNETSVNFISVYEIPCNDDPNRFKAYVVKVKARDVVTNKTIVRKAYYYRSCSNNGGGPVPIPIEEDGIQN